MIIGQVSNGHLNFSTFQLGKFFNCKTKYSLGRVITLLEDFLGVQVGLAEWIEYPLLMLDAPSENTTSFPRSARGSPRSWVHRRISELSEGGGAKPEEGLHFVQCS